MAWLYVGRGAAEWAWGSSPGRGRMDKRQEMMAGALGSATALLSASALVPIQGVDTLAHKTELDRLGTLSWIRRLRPSLVGGDKRMSVPALLLTSTLARHGNDIAIGPRSELHHTLHGDRTTIPQARLIAAPQPSPKGARPPRRKPMRRRAAGGHTAACCGTQLRVLCSMNSGQGARVSHRCVDPLKPWGQ